MYDIFTEIPVKGASFWSSCESLLEINLPRVLPHFDIDFIFYKLLVQIVSKCKIQNCNLQKDEVTSSICDLTKLVLNLVTLQLRVTQNQF